MKESNVIVEYVEGLEKQMRELFIVVLLNSIDALTTAIYFDMNPKASDFSPFYTLFGVVVFVMVKLFMVPIFYYAVTHDIKEKRRSIVFSFYCFLYGWAILVNIWNICTFR